MRGFTLIEVLITVAIITAVSVVGYVSFSKFRGSSNVELTMSELAAAIRDVQKKSVTQEDGKQWGIRFSNSSSSYEVWSGSSYASGTVSRTYYLGRNALFGNPATSTLDAIFSAISGKLAETRVISLISGRKDGVVGDLVLTSRGAITTRKDSGLVGYWHFDEATSTKAYDSSGFANTGTLTNGPTWTAASNCRAGSCLSFDGLNDYVNIPDNTALQIIDEITIAAWIKRDVLDSSYREIVRKGINYFLLINSQNEIALGIQNAYFLEGYPLSGTGNWEHVVGTYSDAADTIKIYLNGVLVNTVASVSLSLTTNTDPLRIGSTEGGVQLFDGSIDEVRVYNRALSDTEIQNLYNDLK